MNEPAKKNKIDDRIAVENLKIFLEANIFNKIKSESKKKAIIK